MRNSENSMIEGVQVERVNVTVAEKMYKKGFSVWMLPCRLGLDNAWNVQPVAYNMYDVDGRTFEDCVRCFEGLYCDKYRGKHPIFFVNSRSLYEHKHNSPRYAVVCYRYNNLGKFSQYYGEVHTYRYKKDADKFDRTVTGCLHQVVTMNELYDALPKRTFVSDYHDTAIDGDELSRLYAFFFERFI